MVGVRASDDGAFQDAGSGWWVEQEARTWRGPGFAGGNAEDLDGVTHGDAGRRGCDPSAEACFVFSRGHGSAGGGYLE